MTVNGKSKDLFDAIVIGGGPAGSAAGALLAQGGMSVCLIEKENFPRFHIGESLLPAGNRILRRLGVWDELSKSDFIEKWGAEFTFGDGVRRVHNIFSRGLLPDMDYTYQVERSRFDTLLLNNARKHGCEVLQPARVTSANHAENRWTVEVEAEGTPPRVLTAPWLLDAGGRNRFLGNKLGIGREEIPIPRRFAAFNHFHHVRRKEGREGGNIIIVRVDEGWFWVIPLDDEKTSVGLVKLRRPNQLPPGADLFNEEVARSPVMTNLMASARPVDEWRVEADFSYLHETFAGENFLLLGDAAGFIDPVFSSGVYLAMESANLASRTILGPARSRGRLTPTEQRRYTRKLRRRMDVMMSLVRVFYHPRDFSIFMQPRNHFSLFAAVNSVVAGNTALPFRLWWRFNLFLLICRLNRRFSFLPEVKLGNPPAPVTTEGK